MSAQSQSASVRAPHGVLVVDKPSGPTSHDVVGRLRRLLRTRAVGHAGTLDPMATGVLVIGVGEGTKLLSHLSGADKAYVANVRLGETTDSLDAQGQVIETAAVPDLSFEQIADVAQQFLGPQVQRVPEISAVRVDGQRLYDRARRGEVVHAPERNVVVHELEVMRVALPEIVLRVRCAKGFYVRALARDLALALGSVGHLTQLRRTHSGEFGLEDAAPPEALSLDAGGAALQARLLPLSAALRGCARGVLNEAGVTDAGHGRPLEATRFTACDPLEPGQQPIALVDEAGVLRALGRAEGDRVLVMRGILCD
jgi:tRNA pseudouridine55 synthase